MKNATFTTFKPRQRGYFRILVSIMADAFLGLKTFRRLFLHFLSACPSRNLLKDMILHSILYTIFHNFTIDFHVKFLFIKIITWIYVFYDIFYALQVYLCWL